MEKYDTFLGSFCTQGIFRTLDGYTQESRNTGEYDLVYKSEISFCRVWTRYSDSEIDLKTDFCRVSLLNM